MALRAQGFGAPAPARPNLGHVRKVVSGLGAVQIDAVNVLVRSHYLPVFSRLGPYDRHLFDRLAFERGDAFECMAHSASFVPIELYGALRWRMAEYATDKYWIAAQAAIESRSPGYLQPSDPGDHRARPAVVQGPDRPRQTGATEDGVRRVQRALVAEASLRREARTRGAVA